MSENTTLEVKSPCISVCAMDDLTGFCQGCYRTVDEIKDWWNMEAVAQKTLLATLEKRQQQLVNFDD